MYKNSVQYITKKQTFKFCVMYNAIQKFSMVGCWSPDRKISSHDQSHKILEVPIIQSPNEVSADDLLYCCLCTEQELAASRTVSVLVSVFIQDHDCTPAVPPKLDSSH